MMSWVLRQCLYDSDHVLQTHENMCNHTLRNDTIILSSDIAVQKFAHNLDVDLSTVKSTLTAVEVVVVVVFVWFVQCIFKVYIVQISVREPDVKQQAPIK